MIHVLSSVVPRYLSLRVHFTSVLQVRSLCRMIEFFLVEAGLLNCGMRYLQPRPPSPPACSRSHGMPSGGSILPEKKKGVLCCAGNLGLCVRIPYRAAPSLPWRIIDVRR